MEALTPTSYVQSAQTRGQLALLTVRTGLSRAPHSTRDDVIVFGLTAVATVAFDLIKAVEAGLLVATVLTLARLSRTAQATAEPLGGRRSRQR